MRPLPLLSLLILLLPLSANSAVIKATKPSHLDHVKLHDTWNSGGYKTSSSSAESLITVRSPATGISFKISSKWKPEYQPYGVRLRLTTNDAPTGLPRLIFVARTAIPKKQSTTLIFRTFMEHSTIASTSQDALGGDSYIPSFHLTSSGSTKVQGNDAISVRYTGELSSNMFAVERVMFATDRWMYTIALRTLPEYEEGDRRAFEGVVKSLVVEEQGGSSSSVGRRRRVKR